MRTVKHPIFRAAYSAVAVALVMAVGAANARAAAGELDQSFGKAGTLNTGLASFFDDPVAIDSAGRIYVHGSLRLLPDGTPDTAFGPGGIRVMPEGVRSISSHLTPEGRLVSRCDRGFHGDRVADHCVLLGGENPSEPGRLVLLGRANAAGREDLAIAPNGSIAFLAGFPSPARVWMLKPTGERATRFGAHGLRRLKSSREPKHREFRGSHVDEIAFDHSSRLLALSFRSLVRLRQNGKVDRSFGKAGVVAGPWDDMVVDNQGRILVSTRNNRGLVRVTRLKTTGKVDRSFGSNGVLTVSRRGIFDVMTVGPAGQIFVAFQDFPNGPKADDVAKIAAFDDRGQLDLSFGAGGSVSDPFGPGTGLLSLVVGAPDRLIAAGTSAQKILLSTPVELAAYKLH